ncbi:MAG: right-handed parallel beta-helix repeat-containing protein [Clostridium sp.]|nr:right-handed parallel beta-helix repeat-containing protein [Clostridium sp.]
MRKTIIFCLCFFCMLLSSVSVQAATIVEEKSENGMREFVISSEGGKEATRLISDCLKSNDNNGVKIVLLPGSYNLQYTLRFKSNTTLIATGATITQTKAGTGFIMNGTSARKKYGSIKNILIDGGTWIGTSAPNKEKTKKPNGYYVGYSGFMFNHGENITIKNCSFKNNYNGHFIEFAAVNNGTITNCNMNMKGSKYIGEATNEAIQIDNTYAKENSPSGEPWDDTPCKNITIKNCNIKYARGIGTNRKGNRFYENIKIADNKITSTKGEGINAYDIKGLTITGNTIKVTHKTNNYLSTGIYIGLDSKISKWGKYSTSITKNNVVGYNNGIKIYSLSGSKFNKIVLKNNTIASRKSKDAALSLHTACIKTITNQNNKLKKAK